MTSINAMLDRFNDNDPHQICSFRNLTDPPSNSGYRPSEPRWLIEQSLRTRGFTRDGFNPSKWCKDDGQTVTVFEVYPLP